MLVLTRKLNEKIVIGNSIRVSVVAIRGGQVRLGIEAPADVNIVREELCPRVTPSAAEDLRATAGPASGSNPLARSAPERV